MSELEWPVERGGTAIVLPDRVETAWRPGSGFVMIDSRDGMHVIFSRSLACFTSSS